jgi:L-malate glycosyltransferase
LKGVSLIKVLVMIPSLDVGGAETDLIRYLPRLDSAKFKIVVWDYRFSGPLARLLLESGIEVMGPDLVAIGPDGGYPAPTKSMIGDPDFTSPYLYRVMQVAGRTMGQAISAARFIRDRDFDVIHAVLPHAYLLAALANVMAGRRPLVVSRLSQNRYHDEHPLFSFVERHLLHRAPDAVVGNARIILDELRLEGLADRKLSLVHNGIDAAAFSAEMIDRRSARAMLNVPQNALVLTSVANLNVYKGHDDLIEGLARVRSRLGADWVLLIAGGDRRGNMARLEGLTLDRGLKEHVRFLGLRLDIPKVLSAADIHVSASHEEGFPNNILEAMCARLPVVATAVGGVPEQIVDGESGLLVSPRDPAGLGEAIVALAHAPEERARLGGNGRRRVEAEFPVDRCANAFGQIYTDLARQRRTIG